MSRPDSIVARFIITAVRARIAATRFSPLIRWMNKYADIDVGSRP